MSSTMASLVLLLSTCLLPFALASESFTYNGDAECTFPFTDFTITTVRCTDSSGAYVQGYNDNSNYNVNNNDGVCSFGNTMSVAGTATLGSTSSKKFSVVMQTCYGGSWSWYSPMTCKKSRSTLDLTNYAMLAEAEYRNQEVAESDYYMQAGTYQWRAGFIVPTKGGYFSTGSSVKVTLTLYPVEPYQDYPYYSYGSPQQYNADISDNRYHSTCFASFDAIPDDEQSSGYYYKAAAGILLFGVATYVTMKRKVICSSCHNDKRDYSTTVVVSDHYKNATDDYDASTVIDYNNADEFDAASIDGGNGAI